MKIKELSMNESIIFAIAMNNIIEADACISSKGVFKIFPSQEPTEDFDIKELETDAKLFRFENKDKETVELSCDDILNSRIDVIGMHIDGVSYSFIKHLPFIVGGAFASETKH